MKFLPPPQKAFIIQLTKDVHGIHATQVLRVALLIALLTEDESFWQIPARVYIIQQTPEELGIKDNNYGKEIRKTMICRQGIG